MRTNRARYGLLLAVLLVVGTVVIVVGATRWIRSRVPDAKAEAFETERAPSRVDEVAETHGSREPREPIVVPSVAKERIATGIRARVALFPDVTALDGTEWKLEVLAAPSQGEEVALPRIGECIVREGCEFVFPLPPGPVKLRISGAQALHDGSALGLDAVACSVVCSSDLDCVVRADAVTDLGGIALASSTILSGSIDASLDSAPVDLAKISGEGSSAPTLAATLFASSDGNAKPRGEPRCTFDLPVGSPFAICGLAPGAWTIRLDDRGGFVHARGIAAPAAGVQYDVTIPSQRNRFAYPLRAVDGIVVRVKRPASAKALQCRLIAIDEESRRSAEQSVHLDADHEFTVTTSRSAMRLVAVVTDRVAPFGAGFYAEATASSFDPVTLEPKPAREIRGEIRKEGKLVAQRTFAFTLPEYESLGAAAPAIFVVRTDPHGSVILRGAPVDREVLLVPTPGCEFGRR